MLVSSFGRLLTSSHKAGDKVKSNAAAAVTRPRLIDSMYPSCKALGAGSSHGTAAQERWQVPSNAQCVVDTAVLHVGVKIDLPFVRFTSGVGNNLTTLWLIR